MWVHIYIMQVQVHKYTYTHTQIAHLLHILELAKYQNPQTRLEQRYIEDRIRLGTNQKIQPDKIFS